MVAAAAAAAAAVVVHSCQMTAVGLPIAQSDALVVAEPSATRGVGAHVFGARLVFGGRDLLL